MSPFGSPYTPPHEFGSPYTPPHNPFHLPSTPQAPAGFANPYTRNEEVSVWSSHQASDEHRLIDQHGHRYRLPAPEAEVLNCGDAINSAHPFSPAYQPSLSVNALEDSQMSQYDQYHLSGSSINKSAGSAGQKRKSAGPYHNRPRRNGPALQPAYAPSSPGAYAPSSPGAYAPSSPRAYAPSSPRAYAPFSPRAYAPSNPRPFAPSSPCALPADLTMYGNGQSAGNLNAGPGSQDSPGAVPGTAPIAQASSAISTLQSLHGQ